MPKDKDPWKTGYGSDASSSDEEDEDDAQPSHYRRAALHADSKLASDLDFHTRYETVKFTPNPFNLAQISAARRSNSNEDKPPSQEAPSSSTAVDGGAGAWKVVTGKKAPPSTSASSEPRRKPGRSIPIANPDPGGRNDVRRLEKQKEEEKKEQAKKKQEEKTKKKEWTRYSGWTEKGKPVPLPKVTKTLTEQLDEEDALAAKKKRKPAAVKKKKAAEVDDEDPPVAPKKAPAKKGKATGKTTAKGKGKKKEEDKITFSRIPADAGPSSSYPILQALDKQRDLPVKPQPHPLLKKPPPAQLKFSHAAALSDDDTDSLSDLPNIDDLFKGITSGAEAELRDAEAKKFRTGPTTRNDGEGVSAPMPRTSSSQGLSAVEALETAVASDVDAESDIVEFDSDEDGDKNPPPVANEQKKQLSELRTALLRENAVLNRRRKMEGRDHSVPDKSGLGRYHAAYAMNDEDASPERAIPQRRHAEPYVSENWKDNGRIYHDELSTERDATNRVVRQRQQQYQGQGYPTDGFDGRYQYEQPAFTVQDSYEHRTYNASPEDLVQPTTITRVSIPQTSKYFAPSSSSQLPYSSPVERHVRQMRNDQGIAVPAPRRLPEYEMEQIGRLESMAQQAYGGVQGGHRIYNDYSGYNGESYGPALHPEQMGETYRPPYHDQHRYNTGPQPFYPATQTQPAYGLTHADWQQPHSRHFGNEAPPGYQAHHEGIPHPDFSIRSDSSAPKMPSSLSDAYSYTPSPRKRALSPESPPARSLPQPIKKIKRTRAERQPLHDPEDQDDFKPSKDAWSTLDPPNKKPSVETIETPKFRLPSNFFALQQAPRSGLSNPKSSSSVASGRKNWFKPSDPSDASKTKSYKENYSTVTSKGVQPGRGGDDASKTRPTFVTGSKTVNGSNARAVQQQDDQHVFRNQLKAAVGIQGQARAALRDIRSGSPGQVNGRDGGAGGGGGEGGGGDWRDAWRAGGQASEPTSALKSKFAYAGPKTSRAAPSNGGRAFDF